MKFQIYIFQNKNNLKIYVGQTINFIDRIKKHIRNSKNPKYNSHFYCALRKNGIDNFNYFIIEEHKSLVDVLEAEQFWIQYFRSWDRNFGYNLTMGGEGNIPTIETREKMSKAKKGKPNLDRRGEKHPFFGLKGEKHHRFGVKHTNEAIKKITLANKNRIYPKGSQHKNSILTENQVIYMREFFHENVNISSKEKITILSNNLKLNYRLVESIVYNMSWKHLTSSNS